MQIPPLFKRLKRLFSKRLAPKRLDVQLGLAFCGVFLLTYALIATLIIRFTEQQAEITLQEYGHTVVRQLAQSSVDTIARNDLVSLHAQLENLTRIPSIAEVAVYDIENQLLAQSIQPTIEQLSSREKSHIIRHFPAMITFQDSIAGKVIIGLDSRYLLDSKHWLLGYLFCGFLLSVFLTAGLSYCLVKYGRKIYLDMLDKLRALQPDLTADLKQSTFGSLPSLSTLEITLKQLQAYIAKLEQGAPVLRFNQSDPALNQAPVGSYAELLIECINLEALQQQIHHRELQRLLESFNEHIQQAGKLYHAHNIKRPGNYILLRFLQDDVTDAALQAVCCAVILRSLTQPSSDEAVYLDHRFIIHWHEHDERPIADLLHNHLLLQEQQELQEMSSQAKAGEILSSKGIKRSAGVAEHIKLELISGDADIEYYRVQKLSDNYKNLLQQQIKQLQEQESQTLND